MHNDCPTKSNTCALIISYHPEKSIQEKIVLTLQQVDKVVIVDNGSSCLEREPLVNASMYSDRVQLILYDENLGQAKALNIGVEYAKKHHYKWILTLDQDSLLAINMVEKMSVCFQSFDESQNVASICPALASYDGVSPMPAEELKLRSFSGEKIDGLYSLVKVAITSGNLLNLDVFDDIGFFEESFFIDYVDQEFSLRLFHAGYEAIQANEAILHHNIGNTTQHSFFGKPLLVSNNSSVRSYYFYRNGVAVYKRYLLRDFKWVANDFMKGFIFNLAKIMLFESNRLDKLKKIFLGLTDGLRDKTGEYKPEN